MRISDWSSDVCSSDLGAAVMRCLGASQRTLVGIHVGEMLLLGLMASALGVAIAFALQWAVGKWLEDALGLSIPPAGWLPALQGLAVGMVVLLAFAAPPVRSEEHTSELQSLMRISYAVFCLQKKKHNMHIAYC